MLTMSFSGQKLTFYILIENDSPLYDDVFKVKRSGFFNEGYRVRYYDAANNDVTGKVNAGTFTTPELGPLWDRGLRDARHGQDPPPGDGVFEPRHAHLDRTSVNNSSAMDAVTFHATLHYC